MIALSCKPFARIVTFRVAYECDHVFIIGCGSSSVKTKLFASPEEHWRRFFVVFIEVIVVHSGKPILLFGIVLRETVIGVARS